jgi:hypothetical protein
MGIIPDLGQPSFLFKIKLEPFPIDPEILKGSMERRFCFNIASMIK